MTIFLWVLGLILLVGGGYVFFCSTGVALSAQTEHDPHAREHPEDYSLTGDINDPMAQIRIADAIEKPESYTAVVVASGIITLVGAILIGWLTWEAIP